jgi:hypothetical protein
MAIHCVRELDAPSFLFMALPMRTELFKIKPPGKTLPTWTEKSQANSIRDFIVLGHNMLLGKLGEMLTTRRITPSDKTPETLTFSPHFWPGGQGMVAEWTTWDENAFVVFQKFFSGSSYFRNWDGSFSTPGPDFYRISGDKWAILFRINSTTSRFGEAYYGPTHKLFGEWCREAIFDVIVTGSYEEMESDMVMYKLMGYTNPLGDV